MALGHFASIYLFLQVVLCVRSEKARCISHNYSRSQKEKRSPVSCVHIFVTYLCGYSVEYEYFVTQMKLLTLKVLVKTIAALGHF